MFKKSTRTLHILIAILSINLSFSSAFAQPAEEPVNSTTTSPAVNKESVELNGDKVEYSVDGNKITAEGNVEIYYKDSRLFCDRVEFFRNSKTAYAKGNVRLYTKTGEIAGEQMTFSFESMTGEFNNALLYADPMYGAGKQISKVNKDLVLVEKGYMTTCDHDKPHFKIRSKKMEVYPQDKIVARNVNLVVGKVPIFYLPKFTQRLNDKKPWLVMTPGYDKQWGMFLLTQIRYYFNENFKGTLHFDAREKKDIAEGLDVDYKIPGYGEGSVRTYYMKERDLQVKHFYRKRTRPTIERERFKAEWRHKWDIDEDSKAILQYYKISDNTFRKDYFEREYDKDSSTKTYFLFTRKYPYGIFSFRTDARVNRFMSATERLPELQYTLSSQKLGNSGLYISNTSMFSNLTKKSASPSENRDKTMRVDSDSQISYPFKFWIFELNPYVGGRHTYYSRTDDPSKYDILRGLFKTGSSISTKFYRIFDVSYNKWGIEINRLRHLIKPSAAYSYTHEPTVRSKTLDQYDGVDSLRGDHKINFALENKLQTKRDGDAVDLVRSTISTPFYLKESPSDGGFGDISSQVEITPVDNFKYYLDSHYDIVRDHLRTVNFDVNFNDEDDPWQFSVGKRWNRLVDDQLTTSWRWDINKKWSFEFYDRYDLERGLQKEQQYVVTRDLHAWKVDIMFNETRGQGDEIMLVFTLKAFPELGFDIGSSFNERKIGSQHP